MSIALYLAMTAADFSHCPLLPEPVAWMALHFSPAGQGLSNCPATLPPGSLLILDDQIPWAGHSGDMVCRTVESLLLNTGAMGLLLDFERPALPETRSLAAALAARCHRLGRAIAMPPDYLGDFAAAVFLPAPPCYADPAKVMAPWQGRTVWLEAALTGYQAEIRAGGVDIQPRQPEALAELAAGEQSFLAPRRLFQYVSRGNSQVVTVNLFDTPDSLRARLPAWEALGVSLAVGPWRQLREN